MMIRRLFLTVMGVAIMGIAACGSTPQVTSQESDKIAVVYYSKSGNTKSIAEAISQLTGADLYEVTTVEAYPEDFRETVVAVKTEEAKGTHREIKAPEIDLAKYSVVILGTPTWDGHVADPLQSWIKEVDLSKNRLVMTYNSYNSSGVSETRLDFEKLLPNSNLGEHFAQQAGTTADNPELKAWLESALKK